MKGIINPNDFHATPRVTVLPDRSKWTKGMVPASAIFIGDNRVPMDEIREAARSGGMRRILAVHEAINRSLTAGR